MGRCRSCDLSRIYKQFEAKKKAKAAEISKPEVKEEPVITVINKSQPTKSKKKKVEPKIEEPKIEISEEKIEEAPVVEEEIKEEIADAE